MVAKTQYLRQKMVLNKHLAYILSSTVHQGPESSGGRRKWALYRRSAAQYQKPSEKAASKRVATPARMSQNPGELTKITL